jgi:hypothetical protein
VFCAEKHLSTAYALANEIGYENLNRMYIIGELVLSQWHLKNHKDEAMSIREIRHLVQNRKENEINGTKPMEMVEKLVEEELTIQKSS